jgi:hypothetical protein
MRVPLALLEDWMRQYYFAVDHDLGSSGVEDYSLAELRRILGLEWEHLDTIVFHDSETLGGARLRQAIADRWAQGDIRRAMATHGSSEANFLIMNALLAPGDEVVVTDPCYPQLFLVAESLRCHFRRLPLRPEQGFRPDVERLCAMIGPATRMVVLNFPHNPTGAHVSPEEQRAIVDACAEVGAYLIWDGAFAEITYDVPPLPDPADLYERAVSMGTLSKQSRAAAPLVRSPGRSALDAGPGRLLHFPAPAHRARCGCLLPPFGPGASSDAGAGDLFRPSSTRAAGLRRADGGALRGAETTGKLAGHVP